MSQCFYCSSYRIKRTHYSLIIALTTRLVLSSTLIPKTKRTNLYEGPRIDEESKGGVFAAVRPQWDGFF